MPKPDKTMKDGAYVSLDTLLWCRHLARGLSLEANKKSVALMEGASRTSFRGRGMEFSEIRPYQPGDDIRNIDWRVTARTQKTYTKLFQEERERPVYILVDQRSPMFFGSVSVFKSVYAAQIAATIAWAAMLNNDRIGALIFSDNAQSDAKARRGKHAALTIVNQLHEFNQQLRAPIPSSPVLALNNMLTEMRRVAKPGSSVYILSDFHDFDTACKEPLALLSRHCDVSALHIFDELERRLPSDKPLAISNGQEKITLTGGQRGSFAQQFTQSFDTNLDDLRVHCLQSGISFASIAASQALEDTLTSMFNPRRKKQRGAS